MSVAKTDKPGVLARIKKPFRSMYQELKRVSWPGRRDLVVYSAAVIGVSLAVALFIYLLDSGIGIIMGLILKIGG